MFYSRRMQNGDGYAGYKWLLEAHDLAQVQPFSGLQRRRAEAETALGQNFRGDDARRHITFNFAL